MIRNSAALRWAGVFVNEAPGTVRKLAEDLNLDAVQLHGEEDPHFVRNLKQALPERCEVWKAWPAAGQTPEVEATGADRLVLDQRDARRRGGTGVAFDWSLVDGFADRERLIVAGGLNPRNAERASRLGVFALDVNSGVESAPGRKSPELLIAFFQALRGRGRS
jgi:indole-3-glycerol phosphate synthase/phosphoribosylanthranilate isomerase